MLKDFSGSEHIYIACGYTDLREGIDGLSLLVQQSFSLDPFGSSLFFVLRKAERPHQGIVLGGRLLRAAV